MAGDDSPRPCAALPCSSPRALGPDRVPNDSAEEAPTVAVPTVITGTVDPQDVRAYQRAARLIAGRGRVGALSAPATLSFGLSLLIVNLLIAVLGSSLVPGAGGAGIAWEAHLAGFLAGVLLIGPFARVAWR